MFGQLLALKPTQVRAAASFFSLSCNTCTVNTLEADPLFCFEHQEARKLCILILRFHSALIFSSRRLPRVADESENFSTFRLRSTLRFLLRVEPTS